MKEDFARIIAGYIVSVLTASAATASIISVGEPAGLGNFIVVLLFGSAYVATCGLPGFALTVFFARKLRQRGIAFFALGGAGNALMAWLVLYVVTGSGARVAEPLFMASIVGGLAGGIAYWSVAVRPSTRIQEPA